WADFVGLNIGANYWTPDLTGSFNTGINPTIDLIGDLGLDDPSSSSFQLILEHPIPLLPNIKYQRFELDSTGSTPGASLIFEGVTFTGNVTSTFDLSHDNIVLYYEVLDNWINLDLGVDLKRFDGEVELTDAVSNQRVLVDETIPLLYLSARFDLPFSGFYVGADINSFSTGDSSVEDSTIMLGYESDSGLGFEGGIKKFSLELNDVNNLNTNLEYDGIYLNGYIHF
ncbi:MAG: TIGR04219 family outer membrane beta-barrel protein, partial [Gammaproteobacteria bacterium]